MNKYTVDITKSPVGPPNRFFKTSWFGLEKETKESIENTIEWQKYIEEYERKLKHE